MLDRWGDMEEVGDHLRAGYRPGWPLMRRLDGVATATRQLLDARGVPTEAAWHEINGIRTVLPPTHFDPLDLDPANYHHYNVAGHLYRLLLDIEVVRSAWLSGDFERAEASASGLFAFISRYGDQMAEQDRWAGRKSREAAQTGAQERGRETIDARNARWRGFAASKPTWTPNRAATQIAKAEGVKLRTVRSVLYDERGARK